MAINCSCVTVGIAESSDSVFQGVDPLVFNEKNNVILAKNELISSDYGWKWRNSWHVIRRQPGFNGTDTGKGPYTLTRSNNIRAFEDMTWAHFLYFPYRGALAEKYDNFRFMEKRIENKRHHSARVVRIDKLSKNFYVATYIRSPSSYKNFYLNRVRKFPPFNLDNSVVLGEDAIYFDVKMTGMDFYGRPVSVFKRMKMPIDNIILLNPKFFANPAKLEDVFVPYEFFNKGFSYRHKGIIRCFKNSGDPMVVKITGRGVIFRFFAKPKIDNL